MKHLACLILLIAIGCNVKSQNFIKIDEHAIRASKSVATNVEDLANYLTKPAKSDQEKVRSFYKWITNTITYDIHAFLNSKLELNSDNETFLKRKKGVCQDYSNLFKALCDASDIKCFVISGYSKGYGFNPKKSFGMPDHAWNAVEIDGEWHLVDATWGSGYINSETKFVRSFNEKFFLGEPKDFILTHLPIDPMWQLLKCPLTIENFSKDSISVKKIISKENSCFDYKDSILKFLELPREEQVLKTAINSHRFNPENKLNIGLAYLNYGADRSKELISKQKELSPEELLVGMEENLVIYEKAKGYLVDVKGPKGKELLEICNGNIRNTKGNIKQLQSFINQ